LFLLFFILLWGGFEFYPEILAVAGIPMGIIILLLASFKDHGLRIDIPDYFWIYEIFLAVILITNYFHLWPFMDMQYFYLSNFIIGAILWLASYNFGQNWKDHRNQRQHCT
jgi:hypothetical protein